MGPSVRTLLTSFLIAAVAPVGMAILDLDPPAFAKNGGGNGGGHGNGHGGGNGNHGNAHGNAKTADTDTATDGDTDTVADTKSHKSKSKTGLTGEDSLSPSALGKLNGVLHASPNAIAHASINSPIGTARAFGEALAGFLDAAATDDTTDDTTDGTTGDETATGDETPPDVDQLGQLGEMMARMTNKPVTAEQVEAVAAKLGIETAPDEAPSDEATGDEATGDEATGDETTGDETTDGETVSDETSTDEPADQPEAPKLDQATAEAIAEKANEIHGFTDDTETTDDSDTTEDADGDTADAGDGTDGDDTGGTDQTVTN